MPGTAESIMDPRGNRGGRGDQAPRGTYGSQRGWPRGRGRGGPDRGRPDRGRPSSEARPPPGPPPGLPHPGSSAIGPGPNPMPNDRQLRIQAEDRNHRLEQENARLRQQVDAVQTQNNNVKSERDMWKGKYDKQKEHCEKTIGELQSLLASAGRAVSNVTALAPATSSPGAPGPGTPRTGAHHQLAYRPGPPQTPSRQSALTEAGPSRPRPHSFPLTPSRTAPPETALVQWEGPRRQGPSETALVRLEERPESPTRPSTFDQPTIELVSEFRQAYTENETWAVEFPRRPITNDPQQPAMQVLYREAGQVIRPGQINQLLQSNTLRPHVIAAIIMRRLFTQVNEQDLFNEWISRDANVGSLVNYVNANPALFPSPEARRAHVFQMIIGNQREYRAWRTELLDRVLHGNAGLLNLFRPAIPENVQENAFQQLRDIVRTMIDLIFRMYTFPRLWTITWRPYIDQGAVNSRYVHQQFFRDNMTARNTPEGQTELGLQGELVALFITPIIGYRDTTGGTIRVDTILRSWVIVKVWRP